MKITYNTLIEWIERIALDKWIQEENVKDIISIFLWYVVENVSIGNDVSIMNFGSFFLRKRPWRVWWDMVNKKKIKKDKKYSMSFKASGNINKFIHNNIIQYGKDKVRWDLWSA